MIERVIENWLDKANERLFQLPFCHLLSAKGYKVIHLSRHCGMELGKDIIAINQEGMPCAFQLKGTSSGKLSLKQWRDGINQQIIDLITLDLKHPSINTENGHLPFFVINGELEEEVIRAIGDLNDSFVKKGFNPLTVIVRGEILSDLKKLGTNFWPFQLNKIKDLLELYLEKGNGCLPKEKFANLFESIFFFADDNLSKQDRSRIISSAAIMGSLASASFREMDNHVAEIEAWTIFSAYLLAYSERWELEEKYYNEDFEIAKLSIFNSLLNLLEELKERNDYYYEGDVLVDQPFYNPRITYLLGLISILGLWRNRFEIYESEIDDFIKDFCLDNVHKSFVWGEGAIPSFLSYYWFNTLLSKINRNQIFGVDKSTCWTAKLALSKSGCHLFV